MKINERPKCSSISFFVCVQIDFFRFDENKSKHLVNVFINDNVITKPEKISLIY